MAKPFVYGETLISDLFKLEKFDVAALEETVKLKDDNEPFNEVSAISPVPNTFDYFEWHKKCEDLVIELPKEKQYVKYYDEEGNFVKTINAISMKTGFWKDVDMGTFFNAVVYLPLKGFNEVVKIHLNMPAYYGVKEDISEYKAAVFNMCLVKARKITWDEYIDEIQEVFPCYR